jgi:hypothetical protein
LAGSIGGASPRGALLDRRGRWLIIATFRAAEVRASPQPHPLAVLLHELKMHQGCVELPLEVLGAPSVEEYLRTRFIARDFLLSSRPARLGAPFVRV